MRINYESRVRFVHFSPSGSIPLRFFTCLRAMYVLLPPPLRFYTMTREKYETNLEAINSPLSSLHDSTCSECFGVLL